MKIFKTIWTIIWTIFALVYFAFVVVAFGFPKTYGKFVKRWTDKMDEGMKEEE